MSAASPALDIRHDKHMYISMRVDKQLIGIPVEQVREVLRQQRVTAIPLAPHHIDGSLNLRGRIITVINMRRSLGLADREVTSGNMFVVVEGAKGELFSLVVDSVGDVLTVQDNEIERVPSNLNGSWKEAATGIYKMAGELLVIVDIKTLLTI
jgi:purine-binding chemotaxis protein CheW